MSLTANGNILPQINQNSSSTVSVGTPIGLAAITQFAGTGNGEVEFSEVVSGAGGIIKDSMGSLQLYGLTPNTFSGGIVVNKGTLYLGAYINGISPTCINPAGTGPVSGTARDFTSPQSYTITGSDSTTQTYTVAITMSDAPAPLTYTFDDAILQGWNNRVWNGSAWMDLAANASTYAGSLLPASTNNGLFVPGNGAVWVSGSTDFHLNTLWLRLPQFFLNGTGNLTVQLAKGIANTAAPANDLAVPSAAVSGGGWKGVALRRVSDGVCVLTKARTGSSGDDFRTVTFTQSDKCRRHLVFRL